MTNADELQNKLVRATHVETRAAADNGVAHLAYMDAVQTFVDALRRSDALTAVSLLRAGAATKVLDAATRAVATQEAVRAAEFNTELIRKALKARQDKENK